MCLAFRDQEGTLRLVSALLLKVGTHTALQMRDWWRLITAHRRSHVAFSLRVHCPILLYEGEIIFRLPILHWPFYPLQS